MSCHTVETGYKNIPVIRTFYSTPDDVLISGFHCTYDLVWGEFGIIGIHLI